MKKKVIETFREIAGYTLGQVEQREPSCFNGNVQVRKYRITIEQIDEPAEIIAARLQQMWDECDNHHHWRPLQAEALKIDYKLIGAAGKNRKKAG